MPELTKFEYRSHWQEYEIFLNRPVGNDEAPLGMRIDGGKDQPYMHGRFKSIIITHITKNSLADVDQRLKAYDVILRVNDIDLTNIKHRQAIKVLRKSGPQVRLHIRRLSPPILREIECVHHGTLGIEIAGGLDDACIPGDPGIFITDTPLEQKQLDIGDRLLQISSESVCYDLRYVTRGIALERMRLACQESKTIKLLVGHTRSLESIQKKTSCEEQHDSLGAIDENRIPVKEDHPTDQPTTSEVNMASFMDVFDADDFRRYKDRWNNGRRNINPRISGTKQTSCSTQTTMTASDFQTSTMYWVEKMGTVSGPVSVLL